jgi:putative membrane protein
MAPMLAWLAMTYLWLKAGHIIFMVFWLAGLFILPRQLLYMLDTAKGSPEEDRWIKRIGLLRRLILTPSLVLTWLLGLALAFVIGAWSDGWLHAKLLFVVLLTAYHGWMVGQARRMAGGQRKLSARALRLWGEVPAVLLAVIVVLVVVKPF